MLTQNVTLNLFFFHRRNTIAPSRMKILKLACDTNTDIHTKNLNFWKQFTIFLPVTVHNMTINSVRRPRQNDP